MLANSPGSPGLWESLTERAHDTPPRSSMLYCPMKILHTCLCVHVSHKAQLPQWQTVRDSQVSRSFKVGRGGGGEDKHRAWPREPILAALAGSVMIFVWRNPKLSVKRES